MFKKLKLKIKNYIAKCFYGKNHESGEIITIGLFLLTSAAAIAIFRRVTGATQDLLGSFVTTISGGFFAAGEAILTMTTKFISFVLNPSFTTKQIVGFTAFDQAWASVRDLTNMLIVLGFVVVGIATTLRWQEYGAKKILPFLIGVAILVNFSGFFCQITIDTANTITNALLQNGAAGGLFTSLGDSIVQSSKNGLQPYIDKVNGPNAKTSGEYGGLVANSFVAFLTMIFSAYIFLILAVLLAARYAVLAALYILSPLAMFFFIFPFTKTYWKMWIENFLKWSFLGMTTGFFITLGLNVIIAGSNAGQIQTEVLLVGFIFIFIGYKMAKTTSAMGASALIGATSAAVGYTMGRVAQAGGLGSSLLTNSRAGQATKQGLTRVGERLGFVAPGTANLMKQEQFQKDESEKRVATLSQAQVRSMNTSGNAVTRRGRNDQTAVAKKTIKSGGLGAYTEEQQKTIIRRAMADGTKMSELAEGDYRVAGYDTEKINKYITAHPTIAGVATTPAMAEVAVRQEQLEKNLPSMNATQLKNINHNDVDGAQNFDFVKENFNAGHISKMQSTEDPRLLAAMKDHVTSGRLATAIADPSISASEKTRLIKLQNAINKYC